MICACGDDSRLGIDHTTHVCSAHGFFSEEDLASIEHVSAIDRITDNALAVGMAALRSDGPEAAIEAMQPWAQRLEVATEIAYHNNRLREETS